MGSIYKRRPRRPPYESHISQTTRRRLRNTYLPPGRVSRDGGNIFNTADLHSSTGKSTEGGLTTRAWGLGSSTTSSAHLDVEGGDADFLASSGDVLSSQHRGVG